MIVENTYTEKLYTFSLSITLENFMGMAEWMFKVSFKTDFSALSYKRLMRLVFFSTNICAKCTWPKCKRLFIQKDYI